MGDDGALNLQHNGPAAFRFTARAAAQIEVIRKHEGRPGAALRIAVESGGCSGFQYSFSLDDSVHEDDVVFDEHGTQVVIDAASLDLLRGGQLDWREALIGAHFQIINPMAASGCSCGASFSVA